MTAPDVETERVLFARYQQTGDRDIRNDLAERHRGLAVSLARRFADRGEPWDDLVQVAMIGLLGAIQRFDPDRGCMFTTFATPTILGELRRHFRDHTWAVKVPRPVKDLHQRVRPAVTDLSVTLGRSPTVAELAAHLDTTDEKILDALEASAAYRPASIHRPPTDPDGPSLEDRLVADSDPIGAFDVVETVRSILARLPERERAVLVMRFNEELSQTQIADRIGVSQMQVSRIVRATLERLSHAPGIHNG